MNIGHNQTTERAEMKEVLCYLLFIAGCKRQHCRDMKHDFIVVKGCVQGVQSG